MLMKNYTPPEAEVEEVEETTTKQHWRNRTTCFLPSAPSIPTTGTPGTMLGEDFAPVAAPYVNPTDATRQAYEYHWRKPNASMREHMIYSGVPHYKSTHAKPNASTQEGRIVALTLLYVPTAMRSLKIWKRLDTALHALCCHRLLRHPAHAASPGMHVTATPCAHHAGLPRTTLGRTITKLKRDAICVLAAKSAAWTNLNTRSQA